MTRTFIALLIPEAWGDYLRETLRDLAEKLPGLSWTKPENLHFTIRFLGNLTDEHLDRVRESVRRSATPLRAPVARLGTLGAFPDPKRPSVLWIGLSRGQEDLEALARAVDGGLQRDGFGRADKPFRAHVTVARPRAGVGSGALASLSLRDPPPEEPLERLAVMKSSLHPTGARYNVLEELRLRRPGSKPGPERPPGT